MATTDARSGFRLPWSGEERPPETDEHDDNAATEASADPPDPARDAAPRTAASAAPSRPAATATRRPNKFLADLTKAMQATAESAREETLARLRADAKAWVEEIHASSADGATDLRRRADDDVAAIREWSKAEMARIREETDTRIGTRKQRLEGEIEQHAAGIEQRVEAIQARVAAFETEMSSFFERLFAEEDPSRFASLAENLPEPPPLDDLELPAPPVSWAADEIDAAPAPTTVLPAEPPEAPTEAPDFAAAEAEALAGVGLADDVDVPLMDDDELATRLAQLMPENAPPVAATQMVETRVVVSGLVRVASIAGFKRQLAKLDGVQSVAVSSGPDGEFVFSVDHADGLVLQDAVAGFESFGARVTGASGDTVEVTARDPDPAS